MFCYNGLVPHPVIAKDSGSDFQPSGSITLDQDSQAHRVSNRGHIPRRHFEIEGNVLLCDAKDVDEPASFNEALHSPDRDEWMTAMQEEMSSMDKNNVWELDLPPRRKTIENKWVLKVKRKADGSIDRYKRASWRKAILIERVLTIEANLTNGENVSS